MVILGKTLSEKTEAIVKSIEGALKYPVEYDVLLESDEPDHAVSMDNGNKKFTIKIDTELADNLFENALIRDLIYCQQMNDGAPALSATNQHDSEAMQAAVMISSIICDIDVENKLKAYDMHIDDIDTMRLSDLFAFLKSGVADYNRQYYHIFASLQVTLVYFTTSKPDNVEQIIQTFHMSDPQMMEQIDKCVDIIDRYGVDDNRSMMRCMRKLALASGMKGRINLEYEGRVSTI